MKNAQFGTLIGTYGKGITGSTTVNFTHSGGQHCDDSCPLKGNVCYAEHTAKLKPSIAKNLEKKESDFSGYLKALTTEKALAKLAGSSWTRFAAFGSIPAPSTWTIQDRMALRLIAAAVSHGNYHFPIETVEKAEALKALGFKNMRVSIGEANEAIAKGFPVSVSFDCGKRAVGKNKRKIAQPAFDYAKTVKATTGLNAKVCPAIPGNAKCGQCTMCADNNVDMVIYPVH